MLYLPQTWCAIGCATLVGACALDEGSLDSSYSSGTGATPEGVEIFEFAADPDGAVYALTSDGLRQVGVDAPLASWEQLGWPQLGLPDWRNNFAAGDGGVYLVSEERAYAWDQAQGGREITDELVRLDVSNTRASGPRAVREVGYANGLLAVVSEPYEVNGGISAQEEVFRIGAQTESIDAPTYLSQDTQFHLHTRGSVPVAYKNYYHPIQVATTGTLSDRFQSVSPEVNYDTGVLQSVEAPDLLALTPSGVPVELFGWPLNKLSMGGVAIDVSDYTEYVVATERAAYALERQVDQFGASCEVYRYDLSSFAKTLLVESFPCGIASKSIQLAGSYLYYHYHSTDESRLWRVLID